MSDSAADTDIDVDDLPESLRRGSSSRKRHLSADSTPIPARDTQPTPSTSQRPFKASKIATTTFTLACFLFGEKKPIFEVSVTPSASINSLQTAIKEVRPRALSDVDAADLDLWKVNVPSSEITTLREEAFKDEDVMDPLKRVAFYFPRPPEEEYIHVVVRRPAASANPSFSSEIELLRDEVRKLPEKLKEQIQGEQTVSLSKFDLSKSPYYYYEFPDLDGQLSSRFPAYQWIADVAESHRTQRAKYKKYLEDVLQLSRYPLLDIFDSSQHGNLLNGEIGDVSVKGTIDLLVTWRTATALGMAIAAMCGIEVKRVGQAAANISQACGELMTLARLQEKFKSKPFIVLTDLNDWWMLFWLTLNNPRTGERDESPLIASQKMDRGSAITVLREELVKYIKPPDGRGTKRTQFSDSAGGGSGGLRKPDDDSGPTKISGKESFQERVSSHFLGRSGSTGDDGQWPSDSDIGYFRDDPGEIVTSYANARKWAMELIRSGGIVGIRLD
ncbi:hypothetical protein HDU93_003522 [Gonapodya sp. JEL0774]|nr:hypothetical protein HDU93_003522 [Gonapodya sp. JEL0774]